MTKNRTIAKECFYEIGTAIEDKKSEAELIEIAKNFAKKRDMDILELAKIIGDVYYHRDKIKKGEMPPKLIEVHYLFLKIKELARDEAKQAVKEAKRKANKDKKPILVVKEDKLSKEEVAEILKKNWMKDEYQKYFQALINAYNRLMPLDLALEEVTSDTGLSAEDIKKYGEIYAVNCAAACEKNLYRIKKEKLNNLLASNDEEMQVRVCAHEIIKIIQNDSENQAKKIKSIVSNANSKILVRSKNAIIKYFTKRLNGVNNDEIRSFLFNQEQMIINIIDEALAESKVPVSKEKPVNVTAMEKRQKILTEYLEKNMIVEDFCDYYYEKYNSKISFKEMQRLLKEASIEARCQDELTIHMQKMYEYEQEYLEKVLGYICYYLHNGVPVDNKTRRSFSIIDYYGVTSYPLEKLKNRVKALNFLNYEDGKLFYTFVSKNSSKGLATSYIVVKDRLKDYKVGLNLSSNSEKDALLEEKKDDISEEVKEAIFEYLEMYNIPMTSRNFNIVLNEYTKNRLYLARR